MRLICAFVLLFGISIFGFTEEYISQYSGSAGPGFFVTTEEIIKANEQNAASLGVSVAPLKKINARVIDFPDNYNVEAYEATDEVLSSYSTSNSVGWYELTQ